MKKPFTKDGVPILGTYEMTPGCALVEGKDDDGELVYSGETKMYWDGQITQTHKDQTIWVDENGADVLDNDVVWLDESDSPDAETGAEPYGHCDSCGKTLPDNEHKGTCPFCGDSTALTDGVVVPDREGAEIASKL